MSRFERPRRLAGDADSHESTSVPAYREGMQPRVLCGAGHLEAVRPQLGVRGGSDGSRALACSHPPLPLPEGKLTIHLSGVSTKS